MGINENQLVSQLQNRAEQLRRVQQRRQNDLDKVVTFYKSLRQADWLTAEELSAISQAGALPLEELNQLKKVQLPAPVSYLVVATDGSIIPPDRHGGMDFCYVLNVGEIALGYGERHTAHIESNTRLQLLGIAEEFQTKQEGQEADRDTGYKSDNKQALLLDAEMAVEELRVALKLAEEKQASVVLRDGPLTLWASSILNNARGKELTADYLALITEFEEKNIPVVGYISNTRSDSVITALKALAQKQAFAGSTPAANPKAGRNRRNSEQNASYQTSLPLTEADIPEQLYDGLLDSDLFRRLLAPGEYSPAFRQSARHSKDAQLTEQIYFCYLRTEYELVKLEFSRQFLNTPELKEALAIIWRQMELGQGYPVALMEAHESAVLRTADRELLRVLLEDYGLIGQESQKGISKRLRGI